MLKNTTFLACVGVAALSACGGPAGEGSGAAGAGASGTGASGTGGMGAGGSVTSSSSSSSSGSGAFCAVGVPCVVGEVCLAGACAAGPSTPAWQAVPWISSAKLNSVAYGAGRFVAVGDDCVLVTSADGMTWAQQSLCATGKLSAVTFSSSGLFVAVGGPNLVYTSQDGLSWTKQKGSTTSGDTVYFTGVAYGNSVFVAVGAQTDGSGEAYASVDGASWVEGGQALPYYALAYGADGKFVAIGAAGEGVEASSDGTTWTGAGTGQSLDFWGATGAGDNVYAVGDNDEILQSADAVVWTVSAANDLHNMGDVLFAIASGGGHLAAVGLTDTGALIATSADGNVWSRLETNIQKQLNGVTYGAGMFVAVGNGLIMRSP